MTPGPDATSGQRKGRKRKQKSLPGQTARRRPIEVEVVIAIAITI